MKQHTLPVFIIVFVSCSAGPILTVPLEEQGGFFEGDLNLAPEQIRDIFINRNAGLLGSNRRWTRDDRGLVNVPFEISRLARYREYFNSEIEAGCSFL